MVGYSRKKGKKKIGVASVPNIGRFGCHFGVGDSPRMVLGGGLRTTRAGPT